jgi:hypothetical protein
MMWRAAVMLPLLVAACADTTPGIVPAPLSPQEQACAAQADQDPKLQEVRAISAGRLEWQWQHEPEIQQIKRDAIMRCLRGRGQVSRGGVERAR